MEALTEPKHKGRPPGPKHPMPMQEFWVLVLEQLPEVELMHRAYLAAELIVEIKIGRAHV